VDYCFTYFRYFGLITSPHMLRAKVKESGDATKTSPVGNGKNKE
jgi:hypothetical protein